MNMHVKAELKLEAGKSYRGKSGATHRVEANDNSAWPFKTADEKLGVSRFWKVDGSGYNTDGWNSHATLGDDLVSEAPKFAVGDKVRVDWPAEVWCGEAVIEEVGNCVVVKYADGRRGGFDATNLTLLPLTYTSCAAAEVDNLADEYGAPNAKFKVGDRVKTDGGFTFDPGYGTVTRTHVNGDANAFHVDVDGQDIDDWFYYASELEHVAVAPATATLRIEAGKFYKTRDGRKVGPYHHAFSDIWRVGERHETAVFEDGATSRTGRESENDLIAEWQDEPAAAKFKVGDRVKFRDDYGSSARGKEATVIKVDEWGVQVDQNGYGSWGVSTEQPSDLVLLAPTTIADIVRKHSGTAIVCLIENGQPKPSTLPFIHSSRSAAATEANRLAGVHKGKEFGVYECVDVKKVEAPKPQYRHEWQRLAAKGEKIAAIKELRSITGMGLLATKNAVEHWVERDEPYSRIAA